MALAFVQSAKGADAGYNSTATTSAFVSSTTTGNMIIVSVMLESGNDSDVSSLTDNMGNTYYPAGGVSYGGYMHGEIWYATNITGGASHTVTYVSSSPYTAGSIIAQEFSGAPTTRDPFDVVGTATAASGTAISSTTPTTTRANAIVFTTAVQSSIGFTLTAGAGFSNLAQQDSVGTTHGVASKIVSSTGTQTGTIDSSNGLQSIASITVVFSDTANYDLPVTTSSTFAGTGADDAGVGTITWSNPTNIYASENTRASFTSSGTALSHYLKATNFGFSVPSTATVLGVKVNIERIRSGGTTGAIRDSTIKLYKAGTVGGSSIANTSDNWPTTEAAVDYGGNGALWGNTLTYSDVNNSGFGVGLSAKGAAAGANRIGNVDAIKIAVTYRDAGSSNPTISVSDSVTISESVGLLVSTPKTSPSDSVTVTESVGVAIQAAGSTTVSKSDTVTVTESVTVRLSTPTINVSDSITVTESKNAAIPVSFGINVSETVTVTESVQINKYSTVFTWKGYSWTRRSGGGGPMYNNQWEQGNVIGPDSNDYMTVRVSNPTGTSPYGAEFYGNTTFGYGTYTAVVGSRVDTMPTSVVFGGPFTYDNALPISYNEIDWGEVSAWGYPVTPKWGHTYWYDLAGVNTGVSNETDATTDAVTTHILTWSPGRLEFRSYAGVGTGGTLILSTTTTTNVPTPAAEVIDFNAWVFGGGPDDETIVAQTDIIIRDFSFAHNKSATDNVTVTEAVTVSVQPATVRLVNKSETVTITEAVTVSSGAVPTRTLSVSDSVTVTEATVASIKNGVAVSDSITVTEALNVSIASAGSVSLNVADNVSVVETGATRFNFGLAVSDTVTTTENVAVAIPTPGINSADNLTITESVGVFIPTLTLQVSDSVTVTESTSVFAPAVGSISVFATESVTVSEYTEAFEPALKLAVSDSITVTESVSAYSNTNLSVSDTITNTDNISFYIGVFSINVSDLILVTEREVVDPFTGSGPITMAYLTLDALSKSITLDAANNELTINSKTTSLSIEGHSTSVILEA